MYENPETKRRPDGSVDTEHYIAVARLLRRQAIGHALRRMAGLSGVLFCGMAALAFSFWCGGGSVLRRSLRTTRQWRAADRVLGLITASDYGSFGHR